MQFQFLFCSVSLVRKMCADNESKYLIAYIAFDTHNYHLWLCNATPCTPHPSAAFEYFGIIIIADEAVETRLTVQVKTIKMSNYANIAPIRKTKLNSSTDSIMFVYLFICSWTLYFELQIYNKLAFYRMVIWFLSNFLRNEGQNIVPSPGKKMFSHRSIEQGLGVFQSNCWNRRRERNMNTSFVWHFVYIRASCALSNHQTNQNHARQNLKFDS